MRRSMTIRLFSGLTESWNIKTDEKLKTKYSDRFEDGEFRKRRFLEEEC